MTPPSANGTVDYPYTLARASNKQCWKLPR